MNILILTDSLALPRTLPEFCHQKDTWPELLRNSGHHVTQVSIGGATSHDLVSQCYYYKKEALNVDLVIVQSGIVDCAPRFAGKTEVKVYKSIPFLGKRIIKMLNRNTVRGLRGITYTNKDKFGKNIHFIKTQYNPLPVYFLGILPASDAYEEQLKGIKKNTALYNSVLKSEGNFIDLNTIPEDGIMSDSHHLNSAGHKFVCDQITQAIQ